MTSKKPQTVRFQCRHIFTDGRRCGSPCLRREDLCYYHHTTRGAAASRAARPHPGRRRRGSRTGLVLPFPEDRSAIQHSIGLVIQHLASGSLDPRRAGILLYGLQTASINLPKPDPKAYVEESVDEITLHPVHGPLAPPAELGANRPMGTAQRLLLELGGDDDEDDEQTEEEEEKDSEESNQAARTPLTPEALIASIARSGSELEPILRCRALGWDEEPWVPARPVPSGEEPEPQPEPKVLPTFQAVAEHRKPAAEHRRALTEYREQTARAPFHHLFSPAGTPFPNPYS